MMPIVAGARTTDLDPATFVSAAPRRSRLQLRRCGKPPTRLCRQFWAASRAALQDGPRVQLVLHQRGCEEYQLPFEHPIDATLTADIRPRSIQQSSIGFVFRCWSSSSLGERAMQSLTISPHAQDFWNSRDIGICGREGPPRVPQRASFPCVIPTRPSLVQVCAKRPRCTAMLAPERPLPCDFPERPMLETAPCWNRLQCRRVCSKSEASGLETTIGADWMSASCRELALEGETSDVETTMRVD